MKTKKVISVGGGMGIDSSEPDFNFNFEFNQLLLRSAGKDNPKVLYIPTASGDSPKRFWGVYENARLHGFDPSILTLFNREYNDEAMREFVLSHDIIYVGGGNTANMLAIWEAQGLTPILREAYERGIVLSGKSAGAICWYEGGVTDSYGPEFKVLKGGLGILKGSYAPHFDNARREILEEAVKKGELPDGIGAPDGVSLFYEDGVLREVVAEDEKLSATEISKEFTKELRPDRIIPREDFDEDLEFEFPRDWSPKFK